MSNSKKTFTTPEGIYDSGGTRKSIKLDDEIAYPLISDEYAIIKEKIQDVKLDNWQTLLLSSGITFIIAAFISIFTYNFYESIKIENLEKQIPILSSFIVVGIYSVLAFASFIGFGLSFKYKKALNSSFIRIDKKILKTFKIENNEGENSDTGKQG